MRFTSAATSAPGPRPGARGGPQRPQAPNGGTPRIVTAGRFVLGLAVFAGIALAVADFYSPGSVDWATVPIRNATTDLLHTVRERWAR